MAHVTAFSPPYPPRMSGRDFRTFQDGRPDEERWELIDGMPVMMTPPLIDHNRIASNLERLLNAAIEAHCPSREAVQRPGVELGLSSETLTKPGRAADYRPEPDLAVIDCDPRPERRFVTVAYLLAEVVSSTDDDPVPATGEPWITVKSRLYRAHAPCQVVIAIEQQRIEVRIASRGPEDWTELTLTDPEDRIALPAFGLSCAVGDLYNGTYLRPRILQGFTPP